MEIWWFLEVNIMLNNCLTHLSVGAQSFWRELPSNRLSGWPRVNASHNKSPILTSGNRNNLQLTHGWDRVWLSKADVHNWLSASSLQQQHFSGRAPRAPRIPRRRTAPAAQRRAQGHRAATRPWAALPCSQHEGSKSLARSFYYWTQVLHQGWNGLLHPWVKKSRSWREVVYAQRASLSIDSYSRIRTA